MKRRDFLKGTTALAAGGALAGSVVSRPARAQSRGDTLLAVSESGPNDFDVHAPGSNRPAYGVSWNVYDRLITWASKTDANGNQSWDSTKFAPELAEEWDLRDMSVTFKLRKNATFHDGTPLTAKDVKWSLDRAVSIPGYPRSQMAVGSMLKTEQFVVVDDHTFRVDFLHPDKLTMPTLGVPVPFIMNSGLVQKHATANDPWGIDWLKNNTAGGGAYNVASRQGDDTVTFVRNDKWTCGALPEIPRIIWRVVPSAATRRALLERGDIDVSFDLPPKDFSEMKANAALRMIGTPMDNSVQYLSMQVNTPPFDNPKVRQAISYAIPYQKIMDVALYNLATPLYGGPAKVTSAHWPQPGPYHTDMAKAKQLLAEAGHPNGFETTLSFDLGDAITNQPMCELMQESLAQIGIRATLDKVPGSGWRADFETKKLPFLTNLYGAWINYPEYFFDWVYASRDSIFDTADYKSPTMDKYIKAAQVETDPAKYEEEVKSFIQLAFDDLPVIPLYQPFQTVAMQKRITGYTYWFFRQLDYRTLKKA